MLAAGKKKRPAGAQATGSRKKRKVLKRPAAASQKAPTRVQPAIPEGQETIVDVPSVEIGSSPESACTLYKKHGLLLLKNAAQDKPLPGYDMMAEIFKNFPEVVDKTWCVENKQSGKLSPAEVFGGDSFRQGSYYSSFLMQGSETGMSCLLQKLPFAEPSMLMSEQYETSHEQCAWLFFGNNEDPMTPLTGRAEHADSVEHAGTWHIQCSGKKTWIIRPLDNLQLWADAGCRCPRLGTTADFDGFRRLHVQCEQGDLLVINTRLWYHHTQLPHTSCPSLSVARDFRWTKDETTAGRRAAEIAMSESGADLGNASVACAPEALDEGAVIFKERPLLAIQSNRDEYLSCDRCAVPIGPPSLHLALIRKEVTRRDIEAGKASEYKDWLPAASQAHHDIPLPQVRDIVSSTRGLFCSETCSQKGCAKSSEVRHFAKKSWELQSQPVQPFLIAYIERVADATDMYHEEAAAICKGFGHAVPSDPEQLEEKLSEILDELGDDAPGWKGKVLYNKMSSVQAGLEFPEPNVMMEFEYDMGAVLMAIRDIPIGEDFNMMD